MIKNKSWSIRSRLFIPASYNSESSLVAVFHVYWWLCPVALYQALGEETGSTTMVQPLVHPSHPMYPAVFMKY